MDFLEENIRAPDKPFNDILANSVVNEELDDNLKNALQASIEFEQQKQLKQFEKNKKINLLKSLDKIYQIYKLDNKEEELFFIECTQKAIQSYLDEKTNAIELYKAHYIELNNILEIYYSKHIQLNRKPKISEELYSFLKKTIISI